MSFIPWRARNAFSQRFPLLYHFAANGKTGNSPAYWDRRLAETWDAPARQWPTKNDLVASLSDPAEQILDVGCGNGLPGAAQCSKTW